MTTIRSHYLPRTYLKHFLNDDVLFMYKKGAKFFDDLKISPSDRILEVRGENGLLNVGVDKHLYDPEIAGISSDDLENIFQELGEDVYDTVISEIETLGNGSPVPPSVKDPLCLMMASMRVRTPLINKNYAVKYPNAYFIKHALLLVEEHINIFHQMTMTICKSNNRFFVTNDNPLVYFVPPEKVNVYNPPKGLVTPHCEVFFPLTKNLAVHMTWKKEEEELREVSRQVIDAFNYNLSHNSWEYIFAPIKINELNIFIQEYIPYPFKFAIH